MILGLNHWDNQNYFGKAIKIKGVWYIWSFDPFDESYNLVDQTKDIEQYIKENKLIKY